LLSSFTNKMLSRSIPSTRRLRALQLTFTDSLRPNLALLTPRVNFTHYSTRVADVKADEGARWQGTCTDGEDTKILIGDQWLSSKATEWFDVRDPVSVSLASSGFALTV
jgi:hypothetical protein